MTEPIPTIIDAARDYLARGFQPTPIVAGEKRPLLDAWQKTILQADELAAHFIAGRNLGLMLGDPSGGLVDVDLDCDEARELADQYLPPTPAITGRPSSPGSHRWYISPGVKTRRHQMPDESRAVICEIRSTSAQTLVGPSIHPSGERYDMLIAQPAAVPGPMLAACVEALARAVAQRRGVAEKPVALEPRRIILPATDHDPAHLEQRAAAYLDRMPAAIAGAGGHNATFSAASALVHGFGLPDRVALEMLTDRYNPRCDPPWSPRELAHKVEQAGRVPHAQPYRYLADAERPAGSSPVDLSGFDLAPAQADEMPPVATVADPGPMPAHLFDIPGLIGDVMRFNLATAFRPQPVLALGAAICLQGVLAGRKVRDDRNTRTNILAIGVAPSGSGKEHGRDINKQILLAAGADRLLGPEELASDAGLVATLERNPASLFQLDEFGRLLRAIGSARGMPHLEGIVTTFLKLYSSAGVLWKSKAYADFEKSKVIVQPHAVVWGTTVRSHLVESLTREQMSDGFVARLLVFEGDPRPPREKRRIAAADCIPPEIIEAAQWWSAFQPGGNLASAIPQPIVVPVDAAAIAAMDEFGDLCDELKHAGGADAESVSSIWARAEEKASRLALIYACSRDRENIVIDGDAARWGIEMVTHLHHRMIFLADGYVAETEFDSKQKKIERLLRDAGGQMPRMDLNRATRGWTPRERDEVIAGMLAGGILKIVEMRTTGRPRTMIALNTRAAEGGEE